MQIKKDTKVKVQYRPEQVQWDAHDFMRFSFNENHNLNIPAPQPFSAVCGIP